MYSTAAEARPEPQQSRCVGLRALDAEREPGDHGCATFRPERPAAGAGGPAQAHSLARARVDRQVEHRDERRVSRPRRRRLRSPPRAGSPARDGRGRASGRRTSPSPCRPPRRCRARRRRRARPRAARRPAPGSRRRPADLHARRGLRRRGRCRAPAARACFCGSSERCIVSVNSCRSWCRRAFRTRAPPGRRARARPAECDADRALGVEGEQRERPQHLLLRALERDHGRGRALSRNGISGSCAGTDRRCGGVEQQRLRRLGARWPRGPRWAAQREQCRSRSESRAVGARAPRRERGSPRSSAFAGPRRRRRAHRRRVDDRMRASGSTERLSVKEREMSYSACSRSRDGPPLARPLRLAPTRARPPRAGARSGRPPRAVPRARAGATLRSRSASGGSR